MTLPILASLALAAAGVPVPAGGGHDAEVRAAASCGHGASAKLKVKRDDGALEVEFELEHSRTPGARWRLVLVHEHRVSWRGSAHARGRNAGFEVSRRVRDFAGPDRVTVRATDPRGLSCSASATLIR
jgi:hypothetical protein